MKAFAVLIVCAVGGILWLVIADYEKWDGTPASE